MQGIYYGCLEAVLSCETVSCIACWRWGICMTA